MRASMMNVWGWLIILMAPVVFALIIKSIFRLKPLPTVLIAVVALSLALWALHVVFGGGVEYIQNLQPHR